MSYPGPPGVSSNSSHPSLPPRPPPSKLASGFKPAFSAAPSFAASAAPTYSNPPSYSNAPPGYAASGAGQYGATPAATSSYSSYSQPPSVGGGRGTYQQSSYNSQPNYVHPQRQAYAGADSGNYTSQAPQIRNPFPAPGAGGDDYDPETAAQIAQWQSAYMPKQPADATDSSGFGGRNAAATGYRQPGPNVAPEPTAGAAAAAGGDTKQKTVYREGGGKKWADDSLLEWDPAHLRLFVGNLAGETTDESLLKAFSRWSSVQRAKVVRDKRTTKSKGYGFVSFSDPDDFFQAAKEMNGKYIQSHPVVVHKAKTEIKPQVAKDDRNHHHGKGKNYKKGGGNKNGSGAGRQDGAGYDPHLGPAAGGGITKPGQKTRGGLKLLG